MPGPIRSLPPPSKRRKVQQDSGVVQSIQRLEADLTHAATNNGSLNPLADLLDLTLELNEPQDTSKAIYALYRVFVLILSNDKLSLDGDDAAKVVKAWLWERLNSYVEFLGGLLKDEEKILRTSALQILFSLQKHLSTSYSKTTPQFHISHFRKIVSYLLLCPPSMRTGDSGTRIIDADVLNQFYETWLSVHDDVRWFFLRESATLLGTTKSNTVPYLATNLLSILERLTTFPTEPSELNAWWVAEMGTKPPKSKHTSKKGSAEAESSDEEEKKDDGDDDDDWRKFFDEEPVKADPGKPKPPGARLHKLTIHQSLHSLTSHRAVFTRAWLTLLPKLSTDSEAGKSKVLATRALNVMHRGVMPHLTRPVLLMDWIGASVDFGGTVGLLALNALFVLMKEYNLDYPSFYTRLYTFLDRDVLHLKHRARFFRMTELFLSSTHLPANLVASFIKRLSRLSINAPPAAIVMIVPFTYNALKRHPALMAMIHRTDVEDPSSDPFLPEATNPLLTQAHLSSLWELMSHKTHYHSGVSTLLKIFSEAFTKPSYAMEDFLDHTYGTLFDTEANRKIKKEPPLAVEMRKPGSLFPVAPESTEKSDAREESTEDNDVVSELWTFS
ncbi:CBF/Mak21 family-domain-containing protein [Collybia nuda]|uniref:CBF/Mak21 family-domain-containing protein n=1 Tax=Collybia nuda TaxID=64659 RepID=A0A9P6C7U7_9AGAR|nr:CBF/Mak21 family-domain-containing protein [Collybia nuda]